MSMRLRLFYLVVAVVMAIIGYKGLTKHQVQTGDGSVALSCVEFNTHDDAERFNKTGVIPAGSKISTKPASECKGVRLAAR